MRITQMVSLISNRKITDVLDNIFKSQWANGMGTYVTKTRSNSCCYFWAMTPAKAILLLRQLSVHRFWIFEGFFPSKDPAPAQSVALLLSSIDCFNRIIAMGEGQAWHFNHLMKVFKKKRQP